MNAPDVKLTQEVLYACAKTSFSGFRTEFNKQNKPEAAVRSKKNGRASTQALRRHQVRRACVRACVYLYSP